MTPFWFVVAALVAYFVAYRVYGKWYDRTVWAPDAKRTTPAHMYADGVEYFPVSKYVLWGFQFKSITALGPILGPFIALTFGWAPALAWIILGNFFIGWLQDYGAIMVSVRNEGRSFGPISHTLAGPEARTTLLGFLLFYLFIGVIAFLFPIGRYWNHYGGAFAADMGIFLTGIIVGRLLYRVRMNVWAVTGLAILGVIVSMALIGHYLQVPRDFLGSGTNLFWAGVACLILYLASVVPLPTFIQPVLWTAFFPTYFAIVLVLLGALLTPVTGIALQQPAFNAAFTWEPGMSLPTGFIWPILFVAIACGAISGWHSLAGSSITSKQLDLETDAHPIGAGCMLSEGLLALISLAAYMVLEPGKYNPAVQVEAWVDGTTRLTAGYLGGRGFFETYFSAVLVLYAMSLLTLVVRVWRMAAAELCSERLPIMANKHVATLLMLAVAWAFMAYGSFLNIWIYTGSANQLMAGLALMLITVHLAKVGARTRWTFIPAIFMTVTTLAALLCQIFLVFGQKLVVSLTTEGYKFAKPLDNAFWTGWIMHLVLLLIGVGLFALGLRMAILLFRSYARYKVTTPAMQPRPAEAD
jgi:carbon starvation protein